MDPSPRGLLEELLGPTLASRLALWPLNEARTTPTIGDDFRAAARRVERSMRIRKLGVVVVLAGLGAWTALTLLLSQTLLASLGPTGVLGVVLAYLTLHQRVRGN